MKAIIIRTHAEIVLITFGFVFNHIIILLAATAYPIKDKKSKTT